MFHAIAHLTNLFKGSKKEDDDKNEPQVEKTPPKYVNMLRQYGSKVRDFSSQYGSNSSVSYSANNIAGPPSSYPNYGDFSMSFVLRTYGKWWLIAPSAQRPFKKILKSTGYLESNDFVDISFETPVIPKAFHILETYNPGSVVRILAFDGNDTDTDANYKGTRWETLWSGNVQIRPAVSQDFSPPLKKTAKPISLIRLEFNHEHLDYYTEIDAVELSGNVVNVEEETQHNQQLLNEGFDTEVTTKLMKQLSINENDDTAIGCLSDNGYFDLLPSEVIHLIFLFLNLDDILRAAATCRLFFHHCYDQVWYKELDLKPFWSKINDMSLQGLYTRCSNIVKLNLSWCGPYGAITSQGFTKFLQRSCSNLTCLRLSTCTFADDDVLEAIVKYCPKLQELDVSSCMKIKKEAFHHLVKLPDLTRLNLYRTNIYEEELVEILRVARRLEHLNIGACTSVGNQGEDTLMWLLTTNCSNLISLDLWRNSEITSESLETLAQGCFQLEELEIGWCSRVICTTGCIQRFVKSHPKMKKLFMAAIRSVHDNDVIAVANHCPDMEQFDILGTSFVGPGTIKKLLAKCPRLVFLDVSFCSQLKWGYIQELRAMYPKVSIKKSFQNIREEES